jgi:hypothetical protein
MYSLGDVLEPFRYLSCVSAIALGAAHAWEMPAVWDSGPGKAAEKRSEKGIEKENALFRALMPRPWTIWSRWHRHPGRPRIEMFNSL